VEGVQLAGDIVPIAELDDPGGGAGNSDSRLDVGDAGELSQEGGRVEPQYNGSAKNFNGWFQPRLLRRRFRWPGDMQCELAGREEAVTTQHCPRPPGRPDARPASPSLAPAPHPVQVAGGCRCPSAPRCVGGFLPAFALRCADVSQLPFPSSDETK